MSPCVRPQVEPPGPLFHCAISDRFSSPVRFRARRRHGAPARFRRDAQRHTHHAVTQRVPRWCVTSRRCWQSSSVSADRTNESCGAASRSKSCERDESRGSRSPESCEVAAESRKMHRRAHSEVAQAHEASAPRCRRGAVRVSGPRQQWPFRPSETVADSAARPRRHRTSCAFRGRLNFWHVACIDEFEMARLMRRLHRVSSRIGSPANRSSGMRSRPAVRHRRHRHVLSVVGGWAHCHMNFHKTNKVCRERGQDPARPCSCATT
jgi:hypothetical protein